MSYEAAFQSVIDDVVAPGAAAVDRDGSFPSEQITALGRAGILSLTIPAGVGGGGGDLVAAAEVVRRLSAVCGSTAMVVTMHYSAISALVATGRDEALRDIVAGKHLTTLALSESGSRSHFWAPLSTATPDGDDVILQARKSWVTAAHEVGSYVWSSRPMSGDGAMTLWHVRADGVGINRPTRFDGLGLRGNDSVPVWADDVRVPMSARLGEDGAGLDIALSAVLPWFLLLNASASVGLMQAVTAETARHLTTTQLEHIGVSLAQQLPARTTLARMQVETDRTRTLVEDALRSITAGLPEAQLRVLEVKAAADEAATMVADLAMRACGGAAFRKELSIERRFRDSLAARVMAPTTDALLDFIGRAMCGLPLLDSASG